MTGARTQVSLPAGVLHREPALPKRRGKRRLTGASSGPCSFGLTAKPCLLNNILAAAARGPHSAQHMGQDKGQHSFPIKSQMANVLDLVGHMVSVTLNCQLQCKSSHRQHVSQRAWLCPSNILFVDAENGILYHFYITIYSSWDFSQSPKHVKIILSSWGVRTRQRAEGRP